MTWHVNEKSHFYNCVSQLFLTLTKLSIPIHEANYLIKPYLNIPNSFSSQPVLTLE